MHYPLLVRPHPTPRPDSAAPTLMRLIPTPPMFTWGLHSLSRRTPQLCSLPPTSVCWVGLWVSEQTEDCCLQPLLSSSSHGVKMLPTWWSHWGCLTLDPGPLVLLVDGGSFPITQTLEKDWPSPKRGAQNLSAWPGDGGPEVPRSLLWVWRFVRNFQGSVLLGPRTTAPWPPPWPVWTQPSERIPLSQAHSPLTAGLPLAPPYTSACFLISGLLTSTSAVPTQSVSIPSWARGSTSELKMQLHFDYSSPSQTEVTVSHAGGRGR